MPSAKRGFKARRRRNRVLRHAQGFYSARGRLFGDAVEQVHNAWADAYAHRTHAQKRDFRRLWITRISAARQDDTASATAAWWTRSRARASQLDRKILADLAVSDPGGFKAVVDAAGARRGLAAASWSSQRLRRGGRIRGGPRAQRGRVSRRVRVRARRAGAARRERALHRAERRAHAADEAHAGAARRPPPRLGKRANALEERDPARVRGAPRRRWRAPRATPSSRARTST